MPVTLDRFVRVMSGGMVVSDELVTVRYSKAQQGLAAVKAQLARLRQAGLEPGAGFVTQLQTMEQQLAAAMQQPNNQAKCDALEPLKDGFRIIADESVPRVDEMLADAAARDRKGAEALAAVNQADQAIRLIADPAFRDPLAARLAGVQNSRINSATATRGPQIKAAVPLLATCVTDANAIAADAARAVQTLAGRTAKLNAIDPLLAGLPGTAEVADIALKNIADRRLAVLRARRNVLAAAGPAQIDAEIAGADALANDITAFSATLHQFVEWGKSKVERTLIVGGCQAYRTHAASDPALAWLTQGAIDVGASLQALVNKCVTDPAAANGGFKPVQIEFKKLQARFGKEILEPKLTPQVNQLILDNADGPEAKMKQALAGPEFTKRLIDVHNTALAFGVNTSHVSPGEMVAIHTYTTNDYEQMNGVLLGIYTPSTPQEAAQIDIKNEQGRKAVEKLPRYPAGITRRGERPWPGADARYTKDVEFTVAQFWSTGVGFNFPGLYQISISGRSGRNVASFSAFPKESEVLFLPGTKFKVLQRDETRSATGALTRVDVVVQEV